MRRAAAAAWGSAVAQVCCGCHWPGVVGAISRQGGRGAVAAPASGEDPGKLFTCLVGSYTAMKIADAGATPTRLPQMPAYRLRPPPDCTHRMGAASVSSGDGKRARPGLLLAS